MTHGSGASIVGGLVVGVTLGALFGLVLARAGRRR